MIPLSSNLKLLRRMHGMTQSDLATSINRSAKAVKDYESGFSEPKLNVLLKISELFKVTVNDLLTRDFNEHPTILLDDSSKGSNVILDFEQVEMFLEATNQGQKIRDGLIAYENLANELDIEEATIGSNSQQLLIILQETLSINWDLIDDMVNVKESKSRSG